LNLQALTEKKKENLVTAIYVGSVFIILGSVYFINQSNSFWSSISDFFTSITLAQVPGVSFSLPAPANPAAHIALYVAVFQFTLGLGILEIGVLALRIYLRSSVTRKAETVGNLVFWLGASFLILAYLVRMTLMTEWFVFWAGIILLGGISLLVRAFVFLAKRLLNS